MFWNKKNKSDNDDKQSSTEIARQDPRTKVRTTVAQTATTNTTVQNSTILSDRARTVTYQTITQTVTHHQMAGVTEIQTRRTATPEELEAFMATMDLGKTTTDENNRPVTRLISKYESPMGIKTTTTPTTAGFGDKQKSTKPTKATSAQPKLKQFITEETTVTQNRGGSVTTHVQEQRVKLNVNRGANTKQRATTAKEATDAPYTSASAFAVTRAFTPLSASTSYTSPYTKRTMTSTDANPVKNTNNNSKFKPPANFSQSTTLTPQPNIRNYTASYYELNPCASTSSLPTNAGSISSATRLNNSPSLPTLRNPNPLQNRPKSKLKPGLVYIFNNEEFDDTKNEYRVGSSVDVKALRETFEAFKLKVEVYKNPTVKEIRNVVKNIETKDYTNRACIVIVILTHGHRFERVLAKNEPYTIDDDVLFPILRNRTLIDKPKIFFIQACKGSMEIGGFHKDAQQPHGAPTEVLKCYSTFEGYVSYRTEDGSVFIQKLCENIKRDGYTKSIDDIMKEVTRSVKMISNQKQIPTITSTMTKPLIFGDYI